MNADSDFTDGVVYVTWIAQTPVYQIAQQIAELERKVNMLLLKFRAQLSKEEIDRFYRYMLECILLGRFHEQENYPGLN